MKAQKPLFGFLLTTLVIVTDAARQSQSQQGHNPSAQKCEDNRSPAESCFDYFKLAIFWSPGYAYKEQATRNARIRNDRQPQWIIHGLWPSMRARIDVPPRCTRTDLYFRSERLNSLRSSLDNSWYSIIATNSNARFWQHEFEAHGSCATRSNLIGDDVNYFARTIELYNRVNLGQALASNGLTPGGVRTLRDVINIMQRAVGAKVKVNTFQDPTTQRLYLTEVHICYDLGLNLMSCPINDPPRHVMEMDVNILANFV